MTEQGKTGTSKLDYAKPLVMAIELKAEEVMGIGCKISGGALPNYNQPAGCGIGNNCQAHGS